MIPEKGMAYEAERTEPKRAYQKKKSRVHVRCALHDGNGGNVWAVYIFFQ